MKTKLKHIQTPAKIQRYTGPPTTKSNITTLIFTNSNYVKQEIKQLFIDGKVFVQIKNGSCKLRGDEELYIEESDKNLSIDI